jgi:hypothetical protein
LSSSRVGWQGTTPYSSPRYLGLKPVYNWTLTNTAHLDPEDGGSLYLWKISNIIHTLERPKNRIGINVNVIFSRHYKMFHELCSIQTYDDVMCRKAFVWIEHPVT